MNIPERRPSEWRAALLVPLFVVAACASTSTPRFAESFSHTTRATGLAQGRVVQDTVTRAQVALGDSIFHGTVGGAICATCHGTNAKGAPGMGPDLTDGKWLHGDGGLKFLSAIIASGVMKPKESGAMMPPYGGTPLTPAQLQVVAAYVWSLSHKSGG